MPRPAALPTLLLGLEQRLIIPLRKHGLLEGLQEQEHQQHGRCPTMRPTEATSMHAAAAHTAPCHPVNQPVAGREFFSEAGTRILAPLFYNTQLSLWRRWKRQCKLPCVLVKAGHRFIRHRSICLCTCSGSCTGCSSTFATTNKLETCAPPFKFFA